MEAMLNNTTKPVVYVTTDFSGCRDAVEMAEIVTGGADTLRHNPFAVCYINVTTGLRHNEEALQKLLYLSGKGLPFTYIPSAQGGVTAPITIAGAMAANYAGVLAGLVLSQLKREGAPFIIPGWGGTQRLPRLVGKTKALEMLLLGTRISASEALRIGLITRLSQPEQVIDDAKELARALAKKAPIAVQVILDVVTRGLEVSIDQGLKIEREGSRRVEKTKDAMEGMTAFIQKREPVFTGE